MNALCRLALRCYRIPRAVSTDDCSMPFGRTITEMRADCLDLAEKGVHQTERLLRCFTTCTLHYACAEHAS